MCSTTPAIWVRPADLTNTRDAADFARLLDVYASDPMGGGESLPGAVKQRLCGDLARFPGALVLLAGLGERRIGFATCLPGYSTFLARPLLNIHDLAVLPANRGQGVGKALLAEIERHARQRGCAKLTLEVREDNPVAERLYRREGFGAGRSASGPIQYRFLEKRLD